MSTASFSLLESDPTTWGVPPVGKTFVGINLAGQIVIKQNDGTITAVVPSTPALGASTNSSGPSTITPTSSIQRFILDVQGAPRSVPVILDIAGAAAGYSVEVLIKLPATAGFVFHLLNADGSGVELDRYTSDGNTVTLKWMAVFQAGAWVLFGGMAPAY